jgi:uncharacterized Ntn-hydrolase superfamily protein
MTWSIIARDKATSSFGIAVATKFFAAGARVPFIAAGVGAIATQALINPFYGTKGLQLLRSGMTADSIIRPLVANDAGRDHRQVHVMDASGRIAAHTGAACIDWNGHLAGDTFSIAGNMLADAQVLDATAAAYIAGEPTPFPRRLIAAMRAGDAAGGDKRGKQSAVLLIYGEDEWSDLDLRVDDHPEPLAELERLESVSRERWTIFRRFLPSRRDPVGVTDRAVIEREIAREHAAGDRQ